MTKKWLLPLVALASLFFSTCDSSSGPSPVVDASLSFLPASGNTETQFTFNAGGSTSTKKKSSLEYRWDWDNDGAWDQTWSSSSSATHTFPTPGTYVVRVEVRDGKVTDQASATLDVSPAVSAILEVSPENGTFLTDFEFDASASTSSSPGMPTLDYRWDLDEDGTYDTDWSTEPTLTTRLPATGTPSVRVQVRDGTGLGDAFASVTMNLNHGQVVDSLVLDASIVPTGLTYDGEHFWISQWGHDETTVRVHSESGAVLTSFPSHSLWTGGLTWDGTHLWQTSWIGQSGLVQLDPANGNTLGSIPVIYTRSRSGLCWDGSAFWHGSLLSATSGGDNKIHKYDPTGNELMVLDVPVGTTEPHGLACDGETLWFIDQSVQTVYQLDPATGAVLNSFQREGLSVITIADGYLWQYGWGPTYNLLLKIVP